MARQLKLPKYKSFRLTKKIKSPQKPLPSARQLLARSWRFLWANKRFFLLTTLVYGLLNFIFVNNLTTGGRIAGTEAILKTAGIDGGLLGNISVFGVALGTSGSQGNQVASVYQFIFLLITSLALIYGMRIIYASKKMTARLSVKAAFYNGMAPLIPFILVLAVVILQLIPLGLSAVVYNSVTTSGVASSGVEIFLWTLFLFLVVLLTLYMLASSLFALYIVTLPNMTPMKALRSARELARHRRSMIVRKLFILPFFVILILGVLVVPLIGVVPVVADIIFYLGLFLALPFVHAYIYTMYRSLL